MPYLAIADYAITDCMVVALIDSSSKAIEHFKKFLIKVSDIVPFVNKGLAKIKEKNMKGNVVICIQPRKTSTIINQTEALY